MNTPNAASSALQSMSLEEVKALGVKLAAHCLEYRKSSIPRSLTQLGITFSAFLAGVVLMYLSLDVSYFLTMALAIPTGIFMVRLFIIQHDCGHGSFFDSSKANNGLGRFLSLFTVTPYDMWKREHAIHHMSCGNLEKRNCGDITTLTVKEYKSSSFMERLKYRLYRNPVILFIIGLPVHFLLIQRSPFGRPLAAKKIWKSVVGLNIALVAFYGSIAYLIGVGTVLLVVVPIVIVASMIGGWLFYVQHQYEDVYWERTGEWNFHLAGLLGSSYYKLPKILQWLTGNIGLHHIHHLNSAIPNYRLQECLDASLELRTIPKKIHLFESFKLIRLALWDEDNQRLVSFAGARSVAT